MTRLILVVFGVVALLSASADTTTTARDDFKVILGGSFNCATGRVKFSKGKLDKQEFRNLDTAHDALARAYNREGVDRLAGLLKQVCEAKEDDRLEPGMESGQPMTAEYRQPESVVEFNKVGNLVTFKVFEYKDNFPPVENAAVRFIDKTRDQKKCRPVSSVCWKCPEGLVCSNPKISK